MKIYRTPIISDLYSCIFILCLVLLTGLVGCATPLGSAAEKGDLNTASTLIKSGADLDEKDIDGYTALHHAAMAGHTEIVKLLIENGADIRAERNGFIPLHSAAYRGQANVVRILLASGSEVNAKTDFGHTPLILAASHGHADVVRLLIENGADLNAKDVNGATAMHSAAFYGHTAVVRILLDAGADPDPGVGLVALGARDTPLDLAQKEGYTAIVSMLRKAEEERYGVSYGSVSNAVSGISARDYYNQGVDYQTSGDHQQSIRCFTKAIDLNPEDAKAYYNRGVSYFKLDNDQLALSDFSKAIELNPRLAEPYHVRGRIYAARRQYLQSVRDSNKAIELNPRFAEAYYTRGLAYLYEGKDYQQAVKDFTRTIELKPMFAEAYYGRGIAYFHLGNDEKGVEDYKTAARMGIKEAEDDLKRKSQARTSTWVPGKWAKKGDKWRWNPGHWDSGIQQSQVQTASVTEANAPSWINQKIQERGTAVIDTTRYQQPGRAQLWAKRAAALDAQRRLIDLVLNLRLDSQTTIRDVLTEDDLDVYSGIARNSYLVGTDSNNTIYTVTKGLNLNDVYLYMKGKGIYYK